MPKPLILFRNLILFVLILLVPKLWHIRHTFDESIIIIIIFTLRIRIFGNEIIIVIFDHFVNFFLVLIVIIILILEVGLFETFWCFRSFRSVEALFSLIFEFENFCLQRLASGLENSILKSFVAETNVFYFVEVLLGKLLHWVLAGNVF